MNRGRSLLSLFVLAPILVLGLMSAASAAPGVQPGTQASGTSGEVATSAASDDPVCLGETSIPKRVNGPGGYWVVTTATLQCRGNFVGMTDRLRLEAYYGGGWHLVNKGSGEINAAGRIGVTVSHPCTSNVSFQFRGYGQLYRNGLQKGVAIPRSSATLQCQA